MTPPTVSRSLTFAALKAKHRAVRDGFEQSLSLRVHRALSWLDRAERETADDDAAFIFYWIAFNAAYADELSDDTFTQERDAFDDYFRRLTEADEEKQIYNAVWERFPQEIRLLLNNRYVFQPFWKFHNGLPGYENWEDRFQRSRLKVGEALQRQNTPLILSTLFDRLYVLRNQLIHGGATWNSAVNRDQVRDGARILALLVPLFVDLMMESPDTPWGSPYYPVVD
jgi:hypothetical protein